MTAHNAPSAPPAPDTRPDPPEAQRSAQGGVGGDADPTLESDIWHVLTFVSRGRGYVGAGEQYPDVEARRALGELELQAQFPDPPAIDAAHIARQRDWSARTFGQGERTAGVVDHIRRELNEVADNPGDVSEWADLIILAIDGATRAGHEPAEVIAAYHEKCAVNEARTWPDWRTAEPGKAIEHVRTVAS